MIAVRHYYWYFLNQLIDTWKENAVVVVGGQKYLEASKHILFPEIGFTLLFYACFLLNSYSICTWSSRYRHEIGKRHLVIHSCCGVIRVAFLAGPLRFGNHMTDHLKPDGFCQALSLGREIDTVVSRGFSPWSQQSIRFLYLFSEARYVSSLRGLNAARTFR